MTKERKDDTRVSDTGVTGPCAVWKGTLDRAGYGRTASRRLAHRAAWERANGAIPKGLCVLHRCDNPPCVNVAHLFLGTQRENVSDMDRKGRRAPKERTARYGEANGRARLTVYDVASIRAARKLGMTTVALGKAYGVPQSHISAICRGKYWTHV